MGILIVLMVSINIYGDFSTLSPGDPIGATLIDYAPGNQATWQVWFDGAGGTHAVFMESHEPDPHPDRGCAYNFKLGGSWYGVVQVNSERAGWVAAGAKASDNGGVCAYHMNASGDIYRPWLAIDEGGQGGYAFTEKPVLPQSTEPFVYPSFAVDDQSNYHFVIHGYSNETIVYTRSTDGGNVWEDTIILYAGQYSNLSGGVFGDRFNTPGKVICYWTQWTGEGTGSSAQHAQDIYYMISTDYGTSWGPKINLTQYQPSDTMRAYCQVKAIFDRDGDPHIVFSTNYFVGGTPYARSWIMHWTPATGFNPIFGPYSMNNDPGAWRLPCDYGNIAVDRDNGWLYAIYSLAQDTIPRNSDIMAKYSTDNGATWLSSAVGDTGVNLTKTPPGVFCNDDFPCMHPYVETINGTKSLIIYYVQDDDTVSPNTEPCTVRVYFAPCDSLIRTEEDRPIIPQATELIKLFPNPCHDRITVNYALSQESKVRIRLLDIAGRLVADLVNRVECTGYHTINYKAEIPAGVYFIYMETEAYKTSERFIILR